MKWTKPLLEAFLAGGWFLFWTDTTLYWISKPVVRKDALHRLHDEKYAAVENDVENIYFWHGVMVPAFVIAKPEWITLQHIADEKNVEVRRVMIERYGQARYLLDSGAIEIHRDDFGVLYQKNMPDDEPILMVKVVNSTPGPDGSFKDYFLRVNPDLRPLLSSGKMGEPQAMTAHNAVASTWGLRGEDYAPAVET